MDPDGSYRPLGQKKTKSKPGANGAGDGSVEDAVLCYGVSSPTAAGGFLHQQRSKERGRGGGKKSGI